MASAPAADVDELRQTEIGAAALRSTGPETLLLILPGVAASSLLPSPLMEAA